MGKKTSQKFITLTGIAMSVLMVVYVATMFVIVHTRDYKETQPSSQFINNINGGDVKLKNEDYDIKKVKCISKKKGEIDLKSLSGSDTEIRNKLIADMGYTTISTTQNKKGDKTINIMADSDDSFDLSWRAYNSPAKLIWFPQHPTSKDFISELTTDYYRPSNVEYDINDVVLFPVIMFVFGIAGAVLVLTFSKRSFFLIFPLLWGVIGLISHISGLVGSTAPQTFIYSILYSLSPITFIIQLVLVILVLALLVMSILFRKKYFNAVKAEEEEYYARAR